MVTVEVKPFVFWHLCVSPWAYFFRSRKYTELNSAIKYTQSTTQIYLEKRPKPGLKPFADRFAMSTPMGLSALF